MAAAVGENVIAGNAMLRRALFQFADLRVTLQAPDGSTENIHVTNPDTLQGVQVGDRITITLTQSVAIALDREPDTRQ